MPYKDRKQQRDAQRAWYQKNKDGIASRKANSKIQARKWVNEYKTKNSVCTDCKISYPPYVLDFDHLADKSFGIARAVQLGTSIKRIKEEIKKCEIVCSNCHRKRTYERSQNS